MQTSVGIHNHRSSRQRVPGEFYDLENDPHEINNLEDEPAYAMALEQHRHILADWIDTTGDRGSTPNQSTRCAACSGDGTKKL